MTPADHYREVERILDDAAERLRDNLVVARDLARGSEAAYADLAAKIYVATGAAAAVAQVHATLAGIPREAHS